MSGCNPVRPFDAETDIDTTVSYQSGMRQADAQNILAYRLLGVAYIRVPTAV
jgi:hypothetical protein